MGLYSVGYFAALFIMEIVLKLINNFELLKGDQPTDPSQMTYVPTKEVKIKEKQDKFLKQQLEKEREAALLEEIEKTEKERVKKKGK